MFLKENDNKYGFKLSFCKIIISFPVDRVVQKDALDYSLSQSTL
jgi:hypothetical protein